MTTGRDRKKRFGLLKAEEGYALPSILFLITILSLVASGIICLVVMRHRLAIREVARVKAEYAAQSGIAKMLAGSFLGNQDFAFGDESIALVEATGWGVYRLVRSRGVYGKLQSTRVALAAHVPPVAFQHALVSAGGNHQLVFAGNSSIRGSVVVGQLGVTTGSLPNAPSPQRVPVTGSIIREASPEIPRLIIDGIEEEAKVCRTILDGNSSSKMSTGRNGALRLDMISDSTEKVLAAGDAAIAGTIVRRERPLYLAIKGRATLCADAVLRGLVCIYSPKDIRVAVGAITEHAILISGERIELEPGSRTLGQIIAPVVDVDSGALAAYPSTVLSIPIGGAAVFQTIRIHGGARVEGFVALTGSGGLPSRDDVIEIERGAIVVGGTCSYNRTTLDGTVIGSIFTKDFYFYEAPTQYIGWIRNGVVDRENLPSCFLVPMVFSGTHRLGVMDWL